MFSTTPSVCSNWRIVVWSWRSSTRRSVMTTIESKTAPVARVVQRREPTWASQAMVKLLPLPAECWMTDRCPLTRASATSSRYAVELLVARKMRKRSPVLRPFVLLLDLVDELAHEVEYAVAGPGLSQR